ncbi:putative HTH-type transcriptional regulator [Aureimonas endophytica]|uniref:HTH-type transcriptional regulator n=2 Tax=Aureimonas endophytica TaxID=2027858 RepID=A0A917E519_9HYPH|nr:putative HTH-type transcriptional regulator [Aureimonas endophytica]
MLSGTGPIYQQIVEAMVEARAAGVLRPGDRLPPQRVLAERLGVDLTTVTRALSEARRRHLVDAAAGRGTFVSARGMEEPILDLGMNIPPSPAGLALPALIRSGIDALLKRSSAEALLSYHPGPGSPAERAAAALWLEPAAGGRIASDRIAVGAGAQSLLGAALATLVREGEAVLADDLTYPGIIGLARTLRLRLASVEADAEGLLPDRLEASAVRHGARLLYLNPTLHNPTTLVMPEARRRDLVAVARRIGLTILEDDPYRALLGEGAPASFLALAPELTFHVATLSKSLSPFLRTAFLAAPNGEALTEIAGNLRSLTLMAPPLMTSLAADWIRSGTAAEIVAGVRVEVAARHALARRLLPDHVKMHPAGLHAWLELKGGRRTADVVEAARSRGLAVSPAIDFAIGGQAPDAIRIALGAVENRDKLTDALTRLAAMIREPEARRAALV